MPDAAVAKCASCGWHQALVQLVPSASEYFKCELPECGRYQPVQVVVRNGQALRSYDVGAMNRQARELNAAADARRKSASLSRQKVRLLEQMSRQAQRRLKELEKSNERWPVSAEQSKPTKPVQQPPLDSENCAPNAPAAEVPEVTNQPVKSSGVTDHPADSSSEIGSQQVDESSMQTQEVQKFRPINAHWIAAGYCPVSYWNPEGPVVGDEGLAVTYQDFLYKLSSEPALEQFIAEPAKYLPEYGGYCALGIASGQLLEVDPMNFKLIGDKLYLFAKHPDDNKLLFEDNEVDNLAKADANWADGSLFERSTT